ncbi:MAG: caspase family protein [Proteobacteria bacterium]|nr:caspase family protein [Pseudomonadota bacterium]
MDVSPEGQIRFFNIVAVFTVLLIYGTLFFVSGCGLKQKEKNTPSFRIISTSLSKGIDITEDDSYPRDVSDIFTSNDTEIVSHVRYANLSGSHHFKWEWYTPDGKLYYATKAHPVKTSVNTYVTQGTSWHKLPMGDILKQNGSGRWKVNIFFDDALVASDFFQIKMNSGNTEFGNFHALVIGNNKYSFLHELKTAENDGRKVASVLEDLYRFKVTLLLNAKRADIMLALNKLRNSLTEDDNLLIFYAGHGLLDEQGDEGYWLPVDAKKDNEIYWISNSYIATVLKAVAARHVLIVSDSCYSGKLSRDAGGPRVSLKNLNYYKNIARKKSRCVISSGGLEPVIDSGGKNGHSIFAATFIDTLIENKGIMDTNMLFTKVRHSVMLNSSQTPEYSDLRNAGHEGGDFLFIRR